MAVKYLQFVEPTRTHYLLVTEKIDPVTMETLDRVEDEVSWETACQFTGSFNPTCLLGECCSCSGQFQCCKCGN